MVDATMRNAGSPRSAARRLPIGAGAILLLGFLSPAAAQEWPRTAPERTDYRETTRHADVVSFLEEVAARSPLIRLDTMGYTMEGRVIPLAIVGSPLPASADAARASGRLVVYLQGNIHGGEVEGKESLLMVLRAIATGEHADWLGSMVLLVAPVYNADGNERVRLTNRPAQHGPVGGMGQRPNAQELDLNRDHTKLESPEARSLAGMMAEWDPWVSMDLHTTNGTRHAYHLTYSPPLHPNTHPAIVALLRERWLPDVTGTIRDEDGWHFYYYGNLQGQGEERGWYTFDHRPRFNNNYIGLRNRIAILSEAYSYATFAERIAATSRFVEEVLDWAHAHVPEIRAAVAEAEGASIVGRELAVRAEFELTAPRVEILMGDVAQERNPYSGAVMLRRLDVVRPDTMPEYGTFRATVTETVPAAYVVPASLDDVIARLEAHGVAVAPLEAEATMRLERFRLDTTFVAAREFQGHRERTIEGEWESAAPRTVPAGAVVVRMDQPLARLIFTLLEPRSDDGFAAWNALDRALEGERVYPVLRVPAG